MRAVPVSCAPLPRRQRREVGGPPYSRCRCSEPVPAPATRLAPLQSPDARSPGNTGSCSHCPPLTPRPPGTRPPPPHSDSTTAAGENATVTVETGGSDSPRPVFESVTFCGRQWAGSGRGECVRAAMQSVTNVARSPVRDVQKRWRRVAVVRARIPVGASEGYIGRAALRGRRRLRLIAPLLARLEVCLLSPEAGCVGPSVERPDRSRYTRVTELRLGQESESGPEMESEWEPRRLMRASRAIFQTARRYYIPSIWRGFRLGSAARATWSGAISAVQEAPSEMRRPSWG